MSGHSKWSTIKRKKEKVDSARAKVFTKIGKEISVAVKMGGADLNKNSRLRDVVLKAKANNVPNSNIDRIIKKAAGEGSKSNYENITYEGYGPEGVAIIVKALTDSKNRTAANVRHYFDKFGGNLGSTGCVSFLFKKKGVIHVQLEKSQQEDFMEFCFNCSALDFKISDDDVASAIVAPEDFYDFLNKLESKGYSVLSASVEEVPDIFVEVKDSTNKERLQNLIDSFEEDDDVQEVYTNCKDC